MLRAFNFSIATRSNEESSNSVGVRKAWGETLELLLSKENVTNGFMLFNRVGTKPWPVFNRMDSTFQSLSSSVPRDHWKWGEIIRRDAKVYPRPGPDQTRHRPQFCGSGTERGRWPPSVNTERNPTAVTFMWSPPWLQHLCSVEKLWPIKSHQSWILLQRCAVCLDFAPLL